jgi:hypothetical protein
MVLLLQLFVLLDITVLMERNQPTNIPVLLVHLETELTSFPMVNARHAQRVTIAPLSGRSSHLLVYVMKDTTVLKGQAFQIQTTL